MAKCHMCAVSLNRSLPGALPGPAASSPHSPGGGADCQAEGPATLARKTGPGFGGFICGSLPEECRISAQRPWQLLMFMLLLTYPEFPGHRKKTSWVFAPQPGRCLHRPPFRSQLLTGRTWVCTSWHSVHNSGPVDTGAACAGCLCLCARLPGPGLRAGASLAAVLVVPARPSLLSLP